jgi:hypothetical protein
MAAVQLTAAHRRLLIVDNGIVSALFNFVLNAAIAWALFRTAVQVPLWGEQSVAGDTLITAFLLPFLTCLIVSRLVAKQVTQGHVPPLRADDPPLAAFSRRSTLARGTLLGVASVALAAVPVVAALHASGFAGFALWPFIGFKATFAALLAAAVTPLVGWWALLGASR